MIVLHESIIERLLYKAVKRHVAGTTISSAIDKAKEFNAKNVPVSISFLSSEVDTLNKARYVASTYAELLHRIARFGLKASVQIPLEELGFEISKAQARNYLDKILCLAGRLGVFVWLEASKPELLQGLPDGRGIGYAIDVSHYSAVPKSPAMKLIFPPYLEGYSKESKKVEGYEDEKKIVLNALRSAKLLVLHSPHSKLINELLKADSKHSLTFEFQLGYEKKHLKKLLKKGVNTSVYIPFGRAWIAYATTKIHGKYTNLLARKFLEKGEKGEQQA